MMFEKKEKAPCCGSFFKIYSEWPFCSGRFLLLCGLFRRGFPAPPVLRRRFAAAALFFLTPRRRRAEFSFSASGFSLYFISQTYRTLSFFNFSTALGRSPSISTMSFLLRDSSINRFASSKVKDGFLRSSFPGKKQNHNFSVVVFHQFVNILRILFFRLRCFSHYYILYSIICSECRAKVLKNRLRI